MQRVFNECQVVPAFSISAFSVDRNLPGELSEVCFCRSRHCCCCCCCVDLQSLCLNLLQEGPTSLPLQGLHQASFRTHRIVHHAISATAGSAGFVELLFYSRLLNSTFSDVLQLTVSKRSHHTRTGTVRFLFHLKYRLINFKKCKHGPEALVFC